MPILTALRLRVQSSLHLLPSTTGLFKKISGLSLAKGKRARVRRTERNKKIHISFKAFKTTKCIKLIKTKSYVYTHIYILYTRFTWEMWHDDKVSWVTHIGILSLRVYYGTGSHYTDSQTSLVKTLSPVTAALEPRDFNHGKQSHNWPRGTIDLIISYLKLHRQEYHNCVQRLKAVFISHVWKYKNRHASTTC